MTSRSVRLLSLGCAFGLWVVVPPGSLNGQSSPSKPAPASAAGAPAASAVPVRSAAATSAEQPRALLDKYCGTCHSDRLKTANLSLQGLDLTHVAGHAELW